MDSNFTSSPTHQNDSQTCFPELNENITAMLQYICLNMMYLSNLLDSSQGQEIPSLPEENFENPDDLAYTCCSMSFQGKRGLHQHIGKAHTHFEKTSLCTQCGRAFKHQNALNFHIKQVHDKSTRVRCTKCGMMVYNKYMMKNHIKKYHPPEANIG
mmetsp:Transcript_10473/g.10457  ORF Transcript_10473/g.10457 Transcript_10473/m.10457 type:complete len:156 (-) Transcript_10473:33-500(-)